MPYLYIETVRERLCRGSRLLLGGLCNDTIVPNALKASPESSEPTRTVRVIFPEQSTDAVIYVTVVIVFYAAIILILVGTNIRRFRRTPTAIPVSEGQNHLHLVVHIDDSERVIQTTSPAVKDLLSRGLKDVSSV